MKDTFKKLLRDYPESIRDKRVFSSYLKDFFPNDSSFTHRIIVLYERGLPEEIRNCKSINHLIVNRFKSILELDYAIDSEKAYHAVCLWCVVYGSEILGKRIDFPMTYMDFVTEVSKSPLHNVDTEQQTSHLIDVASLVSRNADYNTKYVNTSFVKKPGQVFIPCGDGVTDYGYYICGLNEQENCTHRYSYLFAIIYNYLIRNTILNSKNQPVFFNSIIRPYELNYKNIFRLMTIVLQLIKNNMVKPENMCIDFEGDKEELTLAIDIINKYSDMLSVLIGLSEKPKLGLYRDITNETIRISLTVKSDIYVVPNPTPSNAREIWFGRKVRYNIKLEHKPLLEHVLKEISPYTNFKAGQFEALAHVLSAKDHVVCIMPTGSGKSLIYYFAALLQPIPLLIVSPTEILIRDQIRNLEEIHNIDNVCHYVTTTTRKVLYDNLYNNLVFITPESFQNRDFLVGIRNFNSARKISYVVLDEVHCLSNLGHNFRPEYLKLANNLQSFLGSTNFLGFTATANYSVVLDLQKQLGVKDEGIVSPVLFEKSSVSYQFICCDNSRSMYDETVKIVRSNMEKGERTLVFSKTDRITDILAKAIGYEADVLKEDNLTSYNLFAQQKSLVLIAGEELGIGLNLPNIKNVIHFGLPLSKSQYVQEIGRAGRYYERVTSYIVFQRNPDDSFINELLSRSSTNKIHQVDSNNENDYALILKKICNGFETKEHLLNQLIDMRNNLPETIGKRVFSLNSFDMTKKYLYILNILGCIENWYTESIDVHKNVGEIIIAVAATNAHIYTNPNSSEMYQRVRRLSESYFSLFVDTREEIYKVQHSESIEDIIETYVNWYFNKVYNHNKEMFQDFYSFVMNNLDGNRETIQDQIMEFFRLPFVDIKNDDIKFSSSSITDLSDILLNGVTNRSIASAERLISNQYNIVIDCFLLLSKAMQYNVLDTSRLERILENASPVELREVIELIIKVYDLLNFESQFSLIKALQATHTKHGFEIEDILLLVYSKRKKDKIFFGFVAMKIVKQIEYFREVEQC